MSLTLKLGNFNVKIAAAYKGSSGTFADVVPADIGDGKEYVLRTARASLTLARNMKREAEILQKFPRCDHVMHQMYYKITETSITCTIQQLLEHTGVPVTDIRMTISDSLPQFKRILDFLKTQGIVHCDITPKNVTLKPSGTICLVDFNTACYAGTVCAAGSATCNLFRPPEGYFNFIAAYSYDCWSAAIVMLHMSNGMSPIYTPPELRDPRMTPDQAAFFNACIIGMHPRIFSETLAPMLKLDPIERSY